MDKKVEWSDLYNEFRQKYPTWRRLAVGYLPYGYMRIQVQIRGGGLVVYDGLSGKGVIAKEPH